MNIQEIFLSEKEVYLLLSQDTLPMPNSQIVGLIEQWRIVVSN